MAGIPGSRYQFRTLASLWQEDETSLHCGCDAPRSTNSLKVSDKGAAVILFQWNDLLTVIIVIDADANRRATRLVERAFHQQIQAEVTRERLELSLLARTALLSEEDMERLIDYAEQLQNKA